MTGWIKDTSLVGSSVDDIKFCLIARQAIRLSDNVLFGPCLPCRSCRSIGGVHQRPPTNSTKISLDQKGEKGKGQGEK